MREDCGGLARAGDQVRRRLDGCVDTQRKQSALTRTRHKDKPLLVSAAKSVLRGLGTIESTSSLGSGRGGTLESCLAAEVGKYMAVRREVLEAQGDA